MEPISPELYKKLIKAYKSTRWISILVISYKGKFSFIPLSNNKTSKKTNFIKKMIEKTKTKTIEKEKIVAETLNGRFAMIGLIAAIGAYLTTGQIIPGFV